MADNIYKYKQRIEKARDQNGPFSHNIIGLTLSQVSQEFGFDVANGLIDEYDLEDLYNIQKVIQ